MDSQRMSQWQNLPSPVEREQTEEIKPHKEKTLLPVQALPETKLDQTVMSRKEKSRRTLTSLGSLTESNELWSEVLDLMSFGKAGRSDTCTVLRRERSTWRIDQERGQGKPLGSLRGSLG